MKGPCSLAQDGEAAMGAVPWLGSLQLPVSSQQHFTASQASPSPHAHALAPWQLPATVAQS